MRFVMLTVLPLALCGLAGCVLTDSVREPARETRRLTAPPAADARDFSQDAGDEWSYVGEDARGNQTRERDPDTWWKKWIMSEKARNIERNLGYD
ncbi:MAG TPA: hypothetical protein VML55_04360 [Planctomycetaceae bacterium]|nr:hypothetical protein [Planctomycetaceae bacterium]